MRKEKSLAIKLRKQGNSYSQISKKLNIPKGTLSYWFSGLEISDEAKNKILKRVRKTSVEPLIARNKKQTIVAQERARQIRGEAKEEVASLIGDPLFLTGISLYWAEGYKKGASGSKWKSVDFANSDPEMVKIIIKFLKKFLKISKEKIKIQLMAHKNLNINKEVKFWSKLTGISNKQFIKTCTSVSSLSKSKRNINSLTHGTVHIRINDVKLFFKIIGWIDGLREII